jgi:hypothetical protein
VPSLRLLRLRLIDVLTAQGDGSGKLTDDVLLKRATELGIIYAHQLRITIGQMVDDLELIAKATSQNEWWGRI